MDQRINRFKLCDLRFHPYLAGVIERLPEQVRNEVLDDTGFQMLTDDDALKACVLRYRFSEPVKTLVYLNTNLLKEPMHQLIYTIAFEIAHYVLSKRQAAQDAGATNALLRQWGFEKEVAAARSDQALCKSRGYKIGYDWAKKQDTDYLMQHFGIYFDERNDKVLYDPSSEKSKRFTDRSESGSILDDILRLKHGEASDAGKDEFSGPPSVRKAMLAGIMAAMRESSSTPRAGRLSKSS
jgi:hypothetical protein